MIKGQLIEVTPTVDTSAYTSGDHLGSLMTIEGVNAGGAHLGVLEGVVIVDKAKQSSAINILLFDESPTIASSDNGTVNISDAEMADKSIGHIAIAAADYVALSANSVACKRDLRQHIKPIKDSKIYALMVSGGTPTYGAASDLVLKFIFRWE